MPVLIVRVKKRLPSIVDTTGSIIRRAYAVKWAIQGAVSLAEIPGLG